MGVNSMILASLLFFTLSTAIEGGCSKGTYEIEGRCERCDGVREYQDEIGASSCKKCSLGSVSKTDYYGYNTSCAQCDTGTYEIEGKCEHCNGVMEYQDEKGKTSCKKCSLGSVSKTYYGYNTSCAQCDTGTYEIEGKCEHCNGVREYQDEKGKTSCKKCPLGSVSKTYYGYNTSCAQCRAGTYEIEGKCKHCNGVMEYQNEEGKSSCKKCPLGSIPYTNYGYNTSCAQCRKGTFGKDDGKCYPCDGVREYQDKEGKFSCKKCSLGSTPSYYNGYYIRCSSCAKGYFGKDDGKCHPCDGAMEYQDQTGKVSCKKCPLGKIPYYYRGYIGCSSCGKGTFGKDDGRCHRCDGPMEYQDEVQSSTCKKCKSSYAPKGYLDTKTYCYSCLNVNNGECMSKVKCPLGQVPSVLSNRYCYHCRKGTFGKEEGKCHKCDGPMEYQDETGTTSCKTCPSGKVPHNVDGYNIGCITCRKGTYSKNDGECHMCDGSMEYQDDSGATSCKKCPSGTVPLESDGYNVDCSQCRTGTIEKDGKCIMCDGPMEYQDDAGETSCKNCHKGTAPNDFYGFATDCLECRKGFFNESTGKCHSKTKCPIGQVASVFHDGCQYCHKGYFGKEDGKCHKCNGAMEYQNEVGATSCKKCPSGTRPYSFYGLHIACITCRKGTFSKNDGKCHKCHDPMEYQDEEGAISCKNSTLGKIPYYQGGFASGIVSCNKGTFGKEDGKCHKCNGAMEYQDEIGTSSCKKCPLGRIPYDQFGCTSCKIGTFGKNDGKCHDCDGVMEYQNEVGAASCKKCPLGEVPLSIDGFNTSCSPCPIGTFGKSDGKCYKCDGPMEYQDKTGSSSCKKCNSGKYPYTSNGFNIYCYSCKRGTFGNGDGKCLKCTGAMEYQDETGASSCKSCAQGKIPYDNNGFKTTCSPCDRGTFGKSDGKCYKCDSPMEYQNDIGASSCNKCPLGTILSTRGSNNIVCLSCKEGTFGKEDGKCHKCDGPMEYQNGQGATFCKKCPAGEIPNDSNTDCSSCTIGSFEKDGKCYKCDGLMEYQDDRDEISCKTCPLGQIPNEHNSGCSLCKKGTFGKNDGKCHKCEDPMEYQDETGASACKRCPLGLISSSDPEGFKTECQPCGKGKYAKNDGRCYNCVGAMEYQDQLRATSCKECKVGKVPQEIDGVNIRCVCCKWGYSGAANGKCYKDENAVCYDDPPTSAGSYKNIPLGTILILLLSCLILLV
ncbi:proprotein convertase subtilisin/kexin type 5-like [Clytia hemisphaerica]